MVFNMKDFDNTLIKITNAELLDKLPDPFMLKDGTRVSSASQWQEKRKEIYETAVELQYGTLPPKPDFLEAEMLCASWDDIVGVEITTGTKENPVHMLMTVFKPYGEGPFPVVVDGDMCFKYPFNQEFIHTFTDNGIMLACFNRTELAPDCKDFGRNGQLYRTYPDKTFGAVAAWAWGYSRCLDALEKLSFTDMSCVAFTGHSRGGKTALLAGALDERAHIVNPNGSCAGGAGCYRIHSTAITDKGEEKKSETLDDLLRQYPFWMGPQMEKYRKCEEKLPFDQHELKALVAPRILFVSNAANDAWTNLVGSNETNRAVSEVYKFLNAEENLLWYFRRGEHFHDIEDIKMLVNIILNKIGGQPLSDKFFKLPFDCELDSFDWECPV